MIAIVAYATQERAAGNRKFDSIQPNYSALISERGEIIPRATLGWDPRRRHGVRA
jgi:hypothetical protein